MGPMTGITVWNRGLLPDEQAYPGARSPSLREAQYEAHLEATRAKKISRPNINVNYKTARVCSIYIYISQDYSEDLFCPPSSTTSNKNKHENYIGRLVIGPSNFENSKAWTSPVLLASNLFSFFLFLFHFYLWICVHENTRFSDVGCWKQGPFTYCLKTQVHMFMSFSHLFLSILKNVPTNGDYK